MQQDVNNLGCPRTSYTYIVQQGDSLQRIAAAYNTTASAILEANPTTTERLSVGQMLCIPFGDVSNTNTPGNVTGGTGGTGGTGADINAPASPDQGILDGGTDIGVRPNPPTVTVRPTPPTITIIPGGTACPSGYAARTIRAGETYANLLVDNNVSYQAMRAANPTLNPAQLVTGTRYCAPPSGTRQSCTRGSMYRLTEGENLNAVARRFGTTEGRLLMLNPTMLPTDFSGGAVVCVP